MLEGLRHHVKLIGINCLSRQRKMRSRPSRPESVRGTVTGTTYVFRSLGPVKASGLVVNLTTAGEHNGDGTGRSTDWFPSG